ncbi:MAG: hypothetical protein ACRES7_06630 [Gammaproteobacteria bacterium]
MTSTEPLKRPSVKEILTADASSAGAVKSSASGKDVADLLAPLGGLSGGQLELAMKAGEALGKTLGFESSKSVERIFPFSYRVAVRSAAFALRSLGQEITAVFDTPRGAVLETKLPTDIFSLGGTLSLEIVEEDSTQVRITGSSEIKGQKFDWGKGKRSLRDVFDEIEHYGRLLSESA